PRNPGVEEHIQEQFAELAHLFNRFAQPASGTTGDDPSRRQDPLQSVGRLIFVQLLPPMIQQALRTLPAGSALTIATNNPTIPWELVHDGETYLALKFALARQLLTQHAHPPRTQIRSGRWATLLIGNPTGDLPQATQEIEQLAQLIESIPHADRPRLLLRHRATKALILQELASGRYDLIHYSGHALFDAAQPAATGFLLAEDEVLTLREIEEQLSGHPIIFLNGCESARGQTVSAPQAGDDEGFAYLGVAAQGLAIAFIQGGAQAFIGAYWPILDAGSQTFALHFYRLAIQGVALHEALRRTRQFVRSANPSDPLWASYSLYGDPTLPVLSAANYAIRPLTVLMAHLTGLSALYQTVGLERAAELEQNFMGQVAHAVQQYGGEVVDASLPLVQIRFGVPAAQEDSAERALHTALALRTIVDQLNRITSTQLLPGLSMRCGISSDQALTRQAADTPVWLSGNIADAALGLALGAAASEICTDEATRRQAQRAFHF
ncbi:MAG: CHAT domain-containing protein, partial [Caldilineaceae bacterium]|nr:CHAT domain-containing protein [Caldilineaceae bacterium]